MCNDPQDIRLTRIAFCDWAAALQTKPWEAWDLATDRHHNKAQTGTKRQPFLGDGPHILPEVTTLNGGGHVHIGGGMYTRKEVESIGQEPKLTREKFEVTGYTREIASTGNERKGLINIRLAQRIHQIKLIHSAWIRWLVETKSAFVLRMKSGWFSSNRSLNMVKRVLTGWSLVCMRRERKRKAAERAILWHSNRSVKSIVKRWRLSTILGNEKRRLISSMQRLRNSVLIQATWKSWHERLVQVRGLRNAGQRVAAFHASCMLRSAFLFWRKEFRTSARRRATFIRVRDAHFAKLIRRAFLSWVQTWQDSFANRTIVAKFTAKCIQTIRCKVLKSWSSVSLNRRTKRVARSWAATLHNKNLIRASLHHWSQACCAAIFERSREKRAAFLHQRGRLRRVLRCWRREAKDAVTRRSRKARAIAHSVRSSCRSVFRKWERRATAAARMKWKISKFERWSKACAGHRSFSTWRLTSYRNTCDRRVSAIALRTHRRGVLRRAFRKWENDSSAATHHKATEKKIKAFGRRRQERWALRRWRKLVRASRAAGKTPKWEDLLLWVDADRACGDERRLLQWTERRCHSRLRQRSMRAWTRLWCSRKRGNRIAKEHYQRKQMVKAFLGWWVECEERSIERLQLIRTAIAGWRSQVFTRMRLSSYQLLAQVKSAMNLPQIAQCPRSPASAHPHYDISVNMRYRD